MPRYWQTVFDQRLNLGQFLKEGGRIDEASRMYQDAFSISSNLPSDDRGRFAHWTAMARAESNWANFWRQPASRRKRRPPIAGRWTSGTGWRRSLQTKRSSSTILRAASSIWDKR